MEIQDESKSIALTITNEQQKLFFLHAMSSIDLAIVINLYETHSINLISPMFQYEKNICKERIKGIEVIPLHYTQYCLDNINWAYGYLKTVSLLHLLDQVKVILRQQINLLNQEIQIYRSMENYCYR